MKFPFIVALLIAICLSSFEVQSQTDIKRAEALYASGQRNYDEGNYQIASEELDRAILTFEKLNNPQDLVKSLNLLGECKANLGQCDQAIEVLHRSNQLALSKLEANKPLLAETYYYLARAIGGCARKYDEAMRVIQNSLALKLSYYGEDHLSLAFDYTFIGYMLDSKGKYDSALINLNKALAIRQDKLPADDIELSQTYYYLAKVYENKSELNKALDFNIKALVIRQTKLKPTHASLSNSLNTTGSVYQKFGNYDRALDYYQQALEIRKKMLGSEHTNVAGSYYTIGNLYASMFNHHAAINYLQQGNRILEKNFGTTSDILPTYYALIAKLYERTGAHHSAQEFAEKAKTFGEKSLKKDHLYLAIVYNLLGDYYSDVNNLSAQTTYFNKAISIYKLTYGLSSVREADVLLKLGTSHAKNKQFASALKYHSQALSIFKQKLGHKNPKTASVYQAMGDAAQDRHLPEDAVLFYQKAFASLSDNFKDTTALYSDPLLNELGSKPLALRIARNKALTLLQMATKKNSVEILKASLSTYQLAINLMEDIATGYNLEDSKAELEKDNRRIFQGSITVAYELYKLTNDQRYIKEAFEICEKSKSAILIENIRDTNAKMLAGVPDSLISQERDIKIEIAYYQNILRQSQINKEIARIQVNQKNIFEAQERYDQLKKKLENQFPSYYNFKYNVVRSTLERIQQLLVKGSAVVEYFSGDTVIYRIAITKGGSHIIKLKKDKSFESMLSDYGRSLTDPDFILNFRKEADRLYTTSANSLYESLLGSFLNNDNSITRLIIIPDDVLAQLNFGTLLHKKSEGENPDYRNLAYLAKKYQISYAYASAFVNEVPVRTKRAGIEFAGFAPSYSESQFDNVDTLEHPLAYLVVRNGSLALPGAVKEVKTISTLLGGDSWLEAEATETNFKAHAGNYNILHLAMHSLLNNENPHYSELLFNHEHDNKNDGFLNISEIYNLKLNAEMVVLSACSSGFGKIQKGEGPISISRAFSYAGCPSVVMSLWKIPDAVTTGIMTYFYEELEKGRSKDEALKNAQAKFLLEVQDPLYHHPYFWAGFAVIGDTDPLLNKFPMWVIYGSVILIILIAIIFWRNSQSPFTPVGQEVKAPPGV